MAGTSGGPAGARIISTAFGCLSLPLCEGGDRSGTNRSSGPGPRVFVMGSRRWRAQRALVNWGLGGRGRGGPGPIARNWGSRSSWRCSSVKGGVGPCTVLLELGSSFINRFQYQSLAHYRWVSWGRPASLGICRVRSAQESVVSEGRA